MKRDLGAIWHGLIGAALGALIAGFGIAREKWQHPASKLREWTAHRRLEASLWGIGCALAALGFSLWLWLI